MQVFPGNPRQWRPGPYSAEELAAFGRMRQKAGLPLFVHSIYLINLASPDPDLSAKSAAALADALRYATLCEAEAVVTHVGSHRGTGVATGVDRVAATVRKARALASREIPAAELMPLLLEGSAGGGTSLAALPGDLRRLLDAVEGPAGVCIDTAHLFAAGRALDEEGAAGRLAAELAGLGLLPQLGLIHLNDSRSLRASLNDRHENLWDGFIGREGLTAVIGHPAFLSVPFVLEVPGVDGRGPDRRNIRRARIMRRAAAEARACSPGAG
jgi:deoxyribonuclease-4